MHLIRGLIDRLLLLATVITGGLVPGFITQYVQRLGGRLDQALLDLAPWQHIADQYFHGDLAQLWSAPLRSPPAHLRRRRFQRSAAAGCAFWGRVDRRRADI